MIHRLAFEISYIIKNTPWDTGISPSELIHFLETNPPGRSLDLGCGTGTNAITMALHGWDVVGIDLSSIAIMRARRKAFSGGVDISFHRSDVVKLDAITGPFDLVLDIGCFHGLSGESRKEYEINLRRLLRPGGTFLLYSWLRGDEAKPSWSPTEGEERNLFEPTMNITQVEHGVDRVGERSSAWFTLLKSLE
jgi:cyclopropane fatty-acyl-phospholipid synthase-like methyltransferase